MGLKQTNTHTSRAAFLQLFIRPTDFGFRKGTSSVSERTGIFSHVWLNINHIWLMLWVCQKIGYSIPFHPVVSSGISKMFHQKKMIKHMGVSENRLNPIVPNGFADHYPYEKWLFHWEYEPNIFRSKPIFSL